MYVFDIIALGIHRDYQLVSLRDISGVVEICRMSNSTWALLLVNISEKLGQDSRARRSVLKLNVLVFVSRLLMNTM